MQQRGWDVTYLPVRQDGMIDLGQLEAAIRPETALVSVMYVNNEIGGPPRHQTSAVTCVTVRVMAICQRQIANRCKDHLVRGPRHAWGIASDTCVSSHVLYVV